MVPTRWVPQMKTGSEVVGVTLWGTIFNPEKKEQVIKIILLPLFSPTKLLIILSHLSVSVY